MLRPLALPETRTYTWVLYGHVTPHIIVPLRAAVCCSEPQLATVVPHRAASRSLPYRAAVTPHQAASSRSHAASSRSVPHQAAVMPQCAAVHRNEPQFVATCRSLACTSWPPKVSDHSICCSHVATQRTIQSFTVRLVYLWCP